MFSAPVGCIFTVLDYVFACQWLQDVWQVIKVRVSRIQVTAYDSCVRTYLQVQVLFPALKALKHNVSRLLSFPAGMIFEGPAHQISR